ncbi:MAG: hypothetical protein B6D36_15020, partial [Planctomycetes bacterium UTPLA1]
MRGFTSSIVTSWTCSRASSTSFRNLGACLVIACPPLSWVRVRFRFSEPAAARSRTPPPLFDFAAPTRSTAEGRSGRMAIAVAITRDLIFSTKITGTGKSLGLDARAASLPSAARAALSGGDTRLVFVDMALPESEGVDAIAHAAGLDPRPTLPALAAFHGVGRRWQSYGELNGALVIDDYAHHPTEVAATLQAARATGRRVRAVLQPHRWVRTARQWPALAAAAALADEVLVLAVYGAGERPIAG